MLLSQLEKDEMVDALMLIATTKFEPFRKKDYMAFSGVTSAHPMIGHTEDVTIIIDGDRVEIIDSVEGFQVITAVLSAD